MSDPLEFVRNHCGMTGEQVAEMVDDLQAEVARLRGNKISLSYDQKERFQLRARDLMQWLCENCHPHTTIVITSTSAELLEGVVAVSTSEYVKG
jgi:hypothetical protein